MLSKMPEIKIREAKLSDAEALTTLYPHWGIELAKKRIGRALNSKYEKRYVAEFDGKVVAHLLVRFERGAHKHLATFYSLIVHPEYRKKGIATKLVEYAISKLPENIEIVLAQVQHDNVGSLMLFKKLGFEQYGLLKDAWKKEESYKDNILLKRAVRKP